MVSSSLSLLLLETQKSAARCRVHQWLLPLMLLMLLMLLQQ